MASEPERPVTADASYPRGEHPPEGAPAPPAEAASPRGRRRRGRWIWLFLLALAAFALYYEFHPKRAPAPPAAVPSAAITVGCSRTGDMNIYIQALGTVTPVYTISVFSQVTGRLLEVHYQQGQMVRRDDPLVDIDPRPFQAQLTQAEGTLQHDYGLLRQASIDLARYQAAWARNAIARQTLEDQEQLVKQYEGTVKADQGAVDFNRTQLSYCHIVSPIVGRIGLRLVDPGNTVFAGTGSTLAVITQMQPITVVFTVAEDQLPAVEAELRKGHTMRVDTFDRSNEELLATGTLSSLNNEIDTTTGTVKFRADFANSNLALFPNQFVNARLLLKTLRHATLAPSAALQYNGTNAFVYVVRGDHTVKVQPVSVISSNEHDTAVTGLKADVDLATSGFDRLEDGVHVTFRAPVAAQKQAPPAKTRQIRRTPPSRGDP
jgi:multidrug efflux system membrane fusion protein